MREVIFAACLLVAAALVVTGVALLSLPIALMVGGVLFAGWTWFILSSPSSPGGAE